MSTTVRITEHSAHALRALAQQSRLPMQDVLDLAIEQFRRQRMFDEAEAAYVALWADPAASAAETAERAGWDGVLADGLAGR